MKQFFLKLAAEWKLVILPALIKMGFWGVAAVALLDSSSIPVPMDAILAVYVWNDKTHFWLYCLLASIGLPLSREGPPFSTVHVSPTIGSWMTPTVISPATRRAMETQKWGMP